MMNNLFKKILITLLVGIVSSGIFTFCVIAYFSFSLPQISTLKDYKPSIPSQILAKDGTVLANIGKEKRSITQMTEIPDRIINAFLSAEDDNFYEHTGVDYFGVLRAAIANLRAGRVVQGGSTITQQVAKSLLLSSERSISRKIKDFLLARKIEKKLSKQEILFLYLNQVYLGGGYYGIKAAIKGYYEKELAEASIAESAMIAGLLVAPGKYSPYVNPQYAKKRQRYVLGRMFATNKITQKQYQEALSEKIKFRARKSNHFKAGHFTDWIRQKVIVYVGKEKFLNGGFKVLTTLDWDLQQVAEREVLKGAKKIDKRQGFKGPIGFVEKENYAETFKNMRVSKYKSFSKYFTIDSNNERNYELSFDEEKFNQILEHEQEFKKEVRDKHLVPGYEQNDPFFKVIKRGKTYKAIVTKINNWGRLVHIKIGGVAGIIPQKYFRWAHKRNISQNREYYPHVMKPKEILKAGDEILVQVMKKSEKIVKHYSDSFKKYALKSRSIDLVNKQRYLLCLLDQEPEAEAALLSINPFDGEILSFVGGVNFKKSQFNRIIQSRRQPGSSFKPLLYASGLENGYSLNTIIQDTPEALGGVDAGLNWKPRNYDGKFKGPITFRNALEQSRNIPTIKIAEKLSVKTVTEFMDRIGLGAKLDQDLSLALGSFGVNLVDMVNTYAVFPNGGKKVNAHAIISIIDRDGNEYDLTSDEVKDSDAEDANPIKDINEKESAEDEKKVNPYTVSLGGDVVYDRRLAYLMTNLLRGVVLHGTGRRALDVSTFLGGKTGTTNNYIDAWFMGFSSNIVTGVWTGFDNNKTLGWGETGAKSALPIWKEYMREGIRKFGEHDFKVPKGIINVNINKTTGRIASDEDEPFLEAFVEGTEPGSEDIQDNPKSEDDSRNDVDDDDEYYENQ